MKQLRRANFMLLELLELSCFCWLGSTISGVSGATVRMCNHGARGVFLGLVVLARV